MKQGWRKFMAAASALALMGAVVTGCGSGSGGSAGNTTNTGSSPTPSSSDQTVTMRLGIGLNEESTEYKGTVKFQQLVDQYTHGSVKVQLFPSGQLGNDLTMTQQLQSGALEATIPSTSPISTILPDFALFDLPFLFKDAKVADTVLDGPVGQDILKELPDKGLVGLAYWENGFRDLTNSKHPIKTLADLQGIKLRVMQTPVHIAFWKALGANPTPMSFDQVFNALQQHVIDAQENPIQTIYTQKFYEVQKYVTLSHHVYTPFVFLVSKIWWDKLTPDQQQAIQKAAVEAGQYQRQLNRDEAQQDLDQLKAKGMEVDSLSDSEREQWKQKIQPVYDEFTQKNKDMANKLFDAIKQAEAQDK
ncbi:TRAP transporter substrate-binding protein [Alicyclobacillus macrosporangiidus]|uniref:TRAP transporter substrate-binding protein n=1 Tax=Alicyclobacillus macrosporangiidus TaxID=392015 RepID=UPI0026F02B0F|nr:TRAP transporter substrate-binding protein [Alicyclobacillus macrosporangiidus]